MRPAGTGDGKHGCTINSKEEKRAAGVLCRCEVLFANLAQKALIFDNWDGKIRFRTVCSKQPLLRGEKKASKSGNLPKEKRGGCSFDEKGGSAGRKRGFSRK